MAPEARQRSAAAASLLAGLGLLVLAGCGGRTVHEVEIRPEAGRAFERRHDVWSEDRSGALLEADAEVRQRLGAAWGRPAESVAGSLPRVRLTGSFEGVSPGAAGGEARLDRLEGHLGSVVLYTERFGLPASPATSVAADLVAAESLVDLYTAYLRRHPESAAFHRLITRLERVGGRDLAGLIEGLRREQAARAVIVAGAQPARAGTEEAPLVLAATLLVERGWLQSPLAPLGAYTQDDGLADLLSDAAGEPAAGPARAAYRRLLSGPTGAEAQRRFEAFLASPTARASAQRWNARRRAAGLRPVEVPACGPIDVTLLAEPLGPLVPLMLPAWGEGTELRLVLHTGVAPLSTNGAWEAARGVVSWRVARAVSEPALRCFALWAEPDRSRQQRLLGAARLEGEALAGYVSAFQSLTPAQREAWSAAMDAWEPGPDRAAALAALLRGAPDAHDPYARLRTALAEAWQEPAAPPSAPQR